MRARTIYMLTWHPSSHTRLGKDVGEFSRHFDRYSRKHLIRWLYETINRPDAEQLLKEHGEDGSFLVRSKTNTTGEFILSIRWDGDVYHSEIKKEDNNFSLPGYPQFQSLLELIDYLINQDSQLKLAGKDVIIRSPMTPNIEGLPTVHTRATPPPPRVPPRPETRKERKTSQGAQAYTGLRVSGCTQQGQSEHDYEEMYANVQQEEYWVPRKSGVFDEGLPLWQEYEQMYREPKHSRLPGFAKQRGSVTSSASSTSFMRDIRQDRNWLNHVSKETREKSPELDKGQLRIQEILFDFITGEAIFLNTLSVTARVHMEKLDPFRENNANLKKQEFYILFSNITAVRKVSNRLMVMLEKEWKQSDILSPKRIAEFVSEYASRYFVEYVKYVGNHRYQLMQHEQLKKKNRKYATILKGLKETHYRCKHNDLMSFLASPCQHITKLPLYFEDLENCMDMSIEGFEEVQTCIEVLTDIVRKCDAKMLELDDIEQLAKLTDCIKFGSQRRVPLVSSSRFLVKKGTVTHHPAAAKKKTLTLMLFNDLLLILKTKGAKYHLVDHCDRQSSHTQIINPEDDYPEQVDRETSFRLILLNGKKRGFTLSCESRGFVSECKQVAVVKQYNATDVDELTLAVGDVLKVTQEKNEWIKGERLRDSKTGWFPAKRVEEIENPSDHIANLREQQRILQQTIDTLAEIMHLKKKP